MFFITNRKKKYNKKNIGKPLNNHIKYLFCSQKGKNIQTYNLIY